MRPPRPPCANSWPRDHRIRHGALGRVVGHATRPRRGRPALTTALACAAAVLLVDRSAQAAPGQANRLAGVEAQGPATSSVTGIHHNPAMLTSMPGFNFFTQSRGGVDHLLVRRFDIDEAGEPTSELGGRTGLVNPAVGYFLGASFLLDPVAIGVGVYTHETRLRVNSADDLRFHLAPNDDIGCRSDTTRRCPNMYSGGAVEMRTDFSLALAYAFDRVSIGISAHLPRSRTGFAFDNDTGLTSTGGGSGCRVDARGVEDPRCAERLVFHGVTRWRLFGLNKRPSSRFDIAVTFGLSVRVTSQVVLGARYRSRPLLERGVLTYHGETMVCTPNDAVRDDDPEQLPACIDSVPVEATLAEEIPREAAVGAAFVFGSDNRWHLDANLFWIDRCPGFHQGDDCDGRDAQRLSLVGLEHAVSVLPESVIHRGYTDLFGVELWGRYDLEPVLAVPGRHFCDGGRRRRGERSCTPRTELLFGTGFNTPGVRPEATSALRNDGWTLSGSLGAQFEIASRRPNPVGTWHLVPGYGIDFQVPVRVGPGGHEPAYDPGLALAFEESGGDVNHPAAERVLAGRGRPTNAGVYTGLVHSFMLGIRWGERD